MHSANPFAYRQYNGCKWVDFAVKVPEIDSLIPFSRDRAVSLASIFFSLCRSVKMASNIPYQNQILLVGM